MSDVMLSEVLTPQDIGALVDYVCEGLSNILRIRLYQYVPRLHQGMAIDAVIKLLRVPIKPESPDEALARRAAAVLADALERCVSVENTMDTDDLVKMIDDMIAKYKAIGWIQETSL